MGLMFDRFSFFRWEAQDITVAILTVHQSSRAPTTAKQAYGWQTGTATGCPKRVIKCVPRPQATSANLNSPPPLPTVPAWADPPRSASWTNQYHCSVNVPQGPHSLRTHSFP
jgi:hypothetical protein